MERENRRDIKMKNQHPHPRDIPSVEVLVQKLLQDSAYAAFPRRLITYLVRDESKKMRRSILTGKTQWNEDAFFASLRMKAVPFLQSGLRRVVNATGVVIHTNIGRACLPQDTLIPLRQVAEFYCTLEYDVEKGKRGSRHAHVEALIKYLCASEDGFAVNNNAAAVLLALNTFAEGKEVLISRGELVEIGASFRIPDILSKSGAILKEVGTTNKTKLGDYEKAVTKNTGLILKVHPSNFRVVGFTQSVSLRDLVILGRKLKLPVIEDLGSGCLFNLSPYGLDEPVVAESVKSGAAVVTFSGDKLLGGPQAGIIAGQSRYVAKLKKNPLARAVRIDKLSLCALEQTLRLYSLREKPQEHIPVLNMLTRTPAQLRGDAEKLAAKLEPVKDAVDARVEKSPSLPGGGSLPDKSIESYGVALYPKFLKLNVLEAALRMNDIPVIVRIEKNRLLLDVRTLQEDDFQIIVRALSTIFKNA